MGNNLFLKSRVTRQLGHVQYLASGKCKCHLAIRFRISLVAYPLGPVWRRISAFLSLGVETSRSPLLSPTLAANVVFDQHICPRCVISFLLVPSRWVLTHARLHPEPASALSPYCLTSRSRSDIIQSVAKRHLGATTLTPPHVSRCHRTISSLLSHPVENKKRRQTSNEGALQKDLEVFKSLHISRSFPLPTNDTINRSVV